MNQEQAFLAALAENPSDDVTRLVFADWLAERDDPREAWMRDARLARWSLPEYVDPFPKPPRSCVRGSLPATRSRPRPSATFWA